MRPFIIAMVTVLLLTGCSGGGGGTNGSSDGGPSISDFIPGMPDFESFDESDFTSQERQAQEKVAACMKEQGFEYVPYVESQDVSFGSPESDEEFADRYGFGIATMLLEDDQQRDEEEYEKRQAKNPNTAIYDAMNESEQKAYDEALYGEEPDVDFESMTEEEIDAAYGNWKPSGCMNTAYEELFAGGDEGTLQAFEEQFGSQLEDLYEGIDSDPRIVALKDQWSSCMADKGYDFSNPDDAPEYVMRRLQEAGAITDVDDSDGFSYGGAEIEPGSPVEAAVKEIAAEEITIAKASYECQGDVEEVYREVSSEIEQRFIEEHRGELEQFKKDHS